MEATTRPITEDDLFILDAPADSSVDCAIDDTIATFNLLSDQIAKLPDVMQLSRLSEFERQLSARRLLVAARVAGSSGDSRSDRRRARDVLNTGSESSRSIGRDAKRAAAVAANPGLGEAIAGGTIAPDAIDHLAKASDAGTGEVPDELVQTVGGLTPDQTADVVERYMEDQINVDEVEERYQRQMQARTARRYRAGGLAGIAVEGPDQLVDAMWAHLDTAVDGQYRTEGGRDTPVEGRKPLDHRRFDAIHNALTGQPVVGGSGRAAVVITIDGDGLFGEPDSPVVGRQVGTGPLPADLISQYLQTSPISVLIQGSDGAPLWLGRTRRRATDQQFLALAVRDRGCVVCRANITRCDAHHLMPWTAPGRGTTDIDQMALLCGRCHGDLHYRKHTLYRQRGPDGRPVWATRPATPSETPKRRPTPTQRE